MKRILAIIAWILLPILGYGQEYECENGTAIFLSVAPLSEFEGTSAALKGLINFDKGNVDFYLDLNTLKTGITLRDKHMKENYLETKKHPFAEFTGSLVNFKKEDFQAMGTDSLKVVAAGIFKMHGIEKNMTMTGSLIRKSDSQFQLNASFEVLLSDFNISRPSILFYELAESQSVTVSLNFNIKN
jgi:polyisoprenoid-binding protein YceI